MKQVCRLSKMSSKFKLIIELFSRNLFVTYFCFNKSIATDNIVIIASLVLACKIGHWSLDPDSWEFF